MNSADKWDQLSRIYDKELRLLNPDQMGDIDFWKKKGKEYQVKEILEIGCGSGRITIPLLQEGYLVTGLDFSSEMLKKCEKKVNESGFSNFLAVQSDMRKFNLKKQYDLILFGYFAFQQMLTLQDQIDTLLCAKKHLKPDGIIGFDLYPCVCEGEDQKDLEWLYSMPLDDENTVSLFTSYKIDRLNLIKTWIDRYQIQHDDQNDWFQNEISLRECTTEFLQLLLAKCGLQIVEQYGSFAEEAITIDSQNCLYIAQLID